jgi:hypothetical protein
MAFSYLAGPRGQKWDSFVFVAAYNKPLQNVAMLVSRIEYGLFEKSGADWVTCWADVSRVVQTVCSKNGSKVSFLRISCHGNAGVFAVGTSIFSVKNASKWKPEVAKLSSLFTPGVSFVTIDACQTAADDRILQLFSEALGGVDVRGYEETQTENTTAENGRGPFVTCKMTICNRTEN